MLPVAEYTRSTFHVPFWGGPLSDVSARAIFSFKFGIAAHKDAYIDI
jgi:hypothetical protein